MRPLDLFRFCPRCGAPRPTENAGRTPLECPACGLVFHFNPTVAAAGFVFDPAGRILLVRRAKDPAAGKLGVPGGFIDIGEAAEDGLRREVREEVGLELGNLRFLRSFPNVYPYREVLYPVVDLYFTADATDPGSARPLDAVAGIEWLRAADVPNEDIAFPSMRQAIELIR
jgi:ADP-ribose pyrophosphatase YjhB (NUDIX family)